MQLFVVESISNQFFAGGVRNQFTKRKGVSFSSLFTTGHNSKTLNLLGYEVKLAEFFSAFKFLRNNKRFVEDISLP